MRIKLFKGVVYLLHGKKLKVWMKGLLEERGLIVDNWLYTKAIPKNGDKPAELHIMHKHTGTIRKEKHDG